MVGSTDEVQFNAYASGSSFAFQFKIKLDTGGNVVVRFSPSNIGYQVTDSGGTTVTNKSLSW